ncbi:hypothetical protein PFISCL1PPCAC_21615, partial [Pristionchus fissidentatus]
LIQSMSRASLPLLLLALAPLSIIAVEDLPVLGADPTWECGTDQDSKRVAEAEILTHCPKQKKPVNNCCVAHDKCYDDQLGQEHCDNIFCECLTMATKPSKTCAEQDGPFFCELVRIFGSYAYERSGKNGTVDGDSGDSFYDYELETDKGEAGHKKPTREAIIAVAETIPSTDSFMPPLHARVRRMLTTSQNGRFMWRF